MKIVRDILRAAERLPAGLKCLCFYVLIALWLCQALFIGPKGAILGGGEAPDWTGTAWAFWWTDTALSQGLSPFTATHNYFPVGQSPTAWYNLLDAFLAAPLVHLFGLTHGYNAFAILLLISNGLAAHHLSRSLGATHLSALPAGLLWMCTSWILLEVSIGRLSQAMMLFFLLGLTGMEKMAAGNRNRSLAVGSGISIALCALGYWFYGFFLLVGASVLWAARFRVRATLPWTSLLLAAGVTAVLCGAPIIELMRSFESQPGVVRAMEPALDHGPIGRGEFGLNLAIHHGNWILWPWVDSPEDASPSAFPVAIWPVILAGLLLHWRLDSGRRQSIGRWLVMGFIGFAISLGPYLKLSPGEILEVPLPFLFLYDGIPFFSRFWWPDRAIILILPALSVLLSLSLERLRQTRWRGVAWLPLLVILAILGETEARLGPPLPAALPRRVDPVLYEGIEGPILTIPVMGSPDDSRHALWMQTRHGQPITGGLGDHIQGHQPAEYLEFVDSNNLLQVLARLSQGKSAKTIVEPSDIQELLDAGLVWVVVDHDIFPVGDDGEWGRCFRQIFSALWGQATQVSTRGAAWRIQPIDQPVAIPLSGPLPLPATGPYGDALEAAP